MHTVFARLAHISTPTVFFVTLAAVFGAVSVEQARIIDNQRAEIVQWIERAADLQAMLDAACTMAVVECVEVNAHRVYGASHKERRI